MVKVPLYERVALTRDLAEHGLRKGDIGVLVDYVSHPRGGRRGRPARGVQWRRRVDRSGCRPGVGYRTDESGRDTCRALICRSEIAPSAGR